MATAIDMDTVLVETPWTAFGVGSTNTPTYWTGVQGGEYPADPLVPLEGEVVHYRMEEGAYEVVVMGDTGVRQRICGLQMCGNQTLGQYERFIFPDTVGTECDYSEWSEWIKIG